MGFFNRQVDTSNLYDEDQYDDFIDGVDEYDDYEETTLSAVPSAVEPEISRMATVTVETFEDSVHIGTAFRDGTPVVFDISAMNSDNQRRVCDFVVGMRFALGGHLEQITDTVLLLTPASVQVDKFNQKTKAALI